MGFFCLSSALLKVRQDLGLPFIVGVKQRREQFALDELLQDLLSIGSQLKGILEPVQQFVGKLAHILTTRRTTIQKNEHCRCQKRQVNHNGDMQN